MLAEIPTCRLNSRKLKFAATLAARNRAQASGFTLPAFLVWHYTREPRLPSLIVTERRGNW